MTQRFCMFFSVSLLVFLGFSAVANAANFKLLTWAGKDSDRVGEWGNGKPDGRMDGHFQLQLQIPKQRKIQSIAVYSSNAAGTPEGGQVWHSKDTRYWMLGVFSNEQQINTSHVETLGSYTGQPLFDLYCNDSGWFKEGQNFLVEVTFSKGKSLQQVIRISDGGESKIQSITWIGKYTDRIGEWGNGKPDGRLDGHFQLRLNLSQQQEVQSIAVYSSNAAGTPEGGQVWHSKENRYWMLGVVSSNQQINTSHAQTLGSFSGQVVFDLFCNDSGWFNEGQNFLIEIIPGNGTSLKQVIRVASAGGISIKSFAWADRDTDRVGEWGNGKPDGRLDGHFQLRLGIPKARQIFSIAVYSANAAGNPEGGQVWHSRESRYWMLGVFSGEKQLNVSHIPILGSFSGQTLFDLYCNDSGWFKEGQNFLVEIVLIDGTIVKQVARVSFANQVAIQSLTWNGQNSDHVGEWGNGKPDGRMDGHFHLKLNMLKKKEIQSIAVYSANAAGNPEGGQVWHSKETGYWMLGVFSGNQQINPSHVATLGTYTGQPSFDLYCNDSGWFKSGQHFLVEATLIDSSSVKQVIRLP